MKGDHASNTLNLLDERVLNFNAQSDISNGSKQRERVALGKRDWENKTRVFVVCSFRHNRPITLSTQRKCFVFGSSSRFALKNGNLYRICLENRRTLSRINWKHVNACCVFKTFVKTFSWLRLAISYFREYIATIPVYKEFIATKTIVW